jgi:DNA polymerase-1
VKLLREHRPPALAVTLDADVKYSFRQGLDPQYKANREEPTPELLRQFQWCEKLVRALGIALFVKAGFEAEDLMATLACRLTREGKRVVLCSSDKDLGQLVNENVLLFDLAGGEIVDEKAVEDRWGVKPEQLPDLFGLIGDSIDNIPSVPGQGKKTAAALLRAFKTLEGIPTDLERIRTVVPRGAERTARAIAEHRECAKLSRELARIKNDVELVFSYEDLCYRGPRVDDLKGLCDELGLHAFLERALKTLKGFAAGQAGMLLGFK